MEKTWDDFARTGKIADYLKYRGIDNPDEQYASFGVYANPMTTNRLLRCEMAMEWSDKREKEDE